MGKLYEIAIRRPKKYLSISSFRNINVSKYLKRLGDKGTKVTSQEHVEKLNFVANEPVEKFSVSLI